MGFIRNTAPAMKIQFDETIIQDWVDSNLSDYLKFITTDASGVVRYQAKAGDHRFEDPDNTSLTDTLQITCDEADGGILQKSSQIITGNIWEINHGGDIDSSVGAVTISELLIDLADITINDAVALATILNGLKIDASAMLATAVTLSTFKAAEITLPIANATAYISEIGIDLIANKTTDNGAITLQSSRDINGTVAAAVALTNYSTILGQAVNHVDGDFIITQTAATAGVMQLNLGHIVSVATTSPDIFDSTALDINLTGITDTDAGADLDIAARAIDISYVLTETLGTLRLGATDVIRSVLTIPAGISSAAGYEFNFFKLDASGVVLDDVNRTFYGQQIILPTLANTAVGVHITENTNDRIIDLIDLTHSILLSGNTIETSNWLEIKPSAATLNQANTINLISVDTDNWICDDDTNALVVRGAYFNLDAWTETETAATTLEAIRIEMPDQSTYFGSSAIYIIDANGRYIDILTEGAVLLDISAAVVDLDNGYTPISTNRNITGDLSVDRAMTTSSVIHTINNHNASAGDFDLSFASELMALTMQQMCDVTVGAKTDPDTFSATCISIDIDAATTTATAKLDASPRAIDIAYTLTETLGELRMASTDIFRILAQIPDGLSSAGAFVFNMSLLDGRSITLNDVNITHDGLFIDYSTSTLTAFAAFYAEQISIPTLIGTSAGIHVIENTNDRIVDIIDPTSSIKLSGDTTEDSDWLLIEPSAQSILANNTIQYLKIDLSNLTIDNAAGTGNPYLTARQIILQGITETDIATSVLIGDYIQSPLMASKAGYLLYFSALIGDALISPEFILGFDAHGLAVGQHIGINMEGDNYDTRDWIRIKPTTGTAATASDHKGVNIDYTGITANNANLEIKGFRADLQLAGITTIGQLTGVEIQMPNGNYPAFDANVKGTSSGRIEYGACYYDDDFYNRQLKQEWITRVTTGSVGGATLGLDANGTIEMATGAVITNEESLDWNDIFSFSYTLRPTFEVRIAAGSIVNADINIAIGLVNTNIATGMAGQALNQGGAGNQDFILFQCSDTLYGDNFWHLHCQKDGVSTTNASAIIPAIGTFQVLRFEFFSDTAVKWYIDGVLQGLIITNVPTDDLQPILFILTDAGAPKLLVVDYVKIWQDRS